MSHSQASPMSPTNSILVARYVSSHPINDIIYCESIQSIRNSLNYVALVSNFAVCPSLSSICSPSQSFHLNLMICDDIDSNNVTDQFAKGVEVYV